MTRHVGDAVSMVTEGERTEDVEAENLGDSHFLEYTCIQMSHIQLPFLQRRSYSRQITKECCRSLPPTHRLRT